MRAFLTSLFFVIALVAACHEAPASAGAFRVAGAASLSGLLGDALEGFGEGNGSFASSGTLARQIADGAPYDVFVSANEEWVQRIEDGGHAAGERRALAASGLVVVKPKRSGAIDWRQTGRWVTGDPAHVPLGRAARTVLGADWDDLKERLIPVEDARAAVRLVERGEVDWGIVYAHDARSSDVELIVPLEGARVTYYGLLLSTDNDSARSFLEWLDSEAGRALLNEHGLEPPSR